MRSLHERKSHSPDSFFVGIICCYFTPVYCKLLNLFGQNIPSKHSMLRRMAFLHDGGQYAHGSTPRIIPDQTLPKLRFFVSTFIITRKWNYIQWKYILIRDNFLYDDNCFSCEHVITSQKWAKIRMKWASAHSTITLASLKYGMLPWMGSWIYNSGNEITKWLTLG